MSGNMHRRFLTPTPDAPGRMQAQGVVLPDGRLAFVADASPLVWLLDADRQTLQTVALENPIEVADTIAALAYHDGQIGLVTAIQGGMAFAWYDLVRGRLTGREHVELPEPGSARWHVRSVSNGSVLAWRDQTILYISCHRPKFRHASRLARQSRASYAVVAMNGLVLNAALDDDC